MIGLIGKKIGMTRRFDEDGRSVPVTVIETGPCVVTQVKTEATDGYNAVQVGYGAKKAKNTPMPMQGHFRKAGTDPLRTLVEYRMEGEPEFKLGPDAEPGQPRGSREGRCRGNHQGPRFLRSHQAARSPPRSRRPWLEERAPVRRYRHVRVARAACCPATPWRASTATSGRPRRT